MKKFLACFAIIMIAIMSFTMIGCFGGSYNSNSMKSGLESKGYTVEVNAVISGLDVSKMDGYQSNLYAYKTVNEEEYGILILIFDSTSNADKSGSTTGSTATETMSLLMDWGRKHAPETDTSVYGTANNIIWAGCQDAKKAAGIL